MSSRHAMILHEKRLSRSSASSFGTLTYRDLTSLDDLLFQFRQRYGEHTVVVSLYRDIKANLALLVGDEATFAAPAEEAAEEAVEAEEATEEAAE